MECLFCRDLRKDCKPELGMGLICFRCFHILNLVEQDYLRQLCRMSSDEGNTEKIRLINNFLIIKHPGETNDRETKELKRSDLLSDNFFS